MKLIAAALFVLALTFATNADASASPASSGCEETWGGGCIHLDNGGGGPLWVHTVQPGVWGAGKTLCGRYHVRLTRKSNGIPTVIRTSGWTCPFIPSGSPVYGPTYQLDKPYADGDVFCGNFDGYHPKDWGCVRIHG